MLAVVSAAMLDAEMPTSRVETTRNVRPTIVNRRRLSRIGMVMRPVIKDEPLRTATPLADLAR